MKQILPDGQYSVLSRNCPSRQLFSQLGDRWTLLVMCALSAEPQRFGQLKGDVEGISQRMLTQTLRELERDGLVRREIFAEVPPRVEYRLTPLGEELREVTRPLRHWVYGHIEEIQEAREQDFRRHQQVALEQRG